VTIESGSQADPAFDLVVIEAVAGIELCETLLSFGEKVEAFDCILDARIISEIIKSVQDALFRSYGLHPATIPHPSTLENASESPVKRALLRRDLSQIRFAACWLRHTPQGYGGVCFTFRQSINPSGFDRPLSAVLGSNTSGSLIWNGRSPLKYD
jgi:hypothetical protein